MWACNIEVECELWWQSSASYAVLAVSPGLSWLKDGLTQAIANYHDYEDMHF